MSTPQRGLWPFVRTVLAILFSPIAEKDRARFDAVDAPYVLSRGQIIQIGISGAFITALLGDISPGWPIIFLGCMCLVVAVFDKQLRRASVEQAVGILGRLTDRFGVGENGPRVVGGSVETEIETSGGDLFASPVAAEAETRGADGTTATANTESDDAPVTRAAPAPAAAAPISTAAPARTTPQKIAGRAIAPAPASDDLAGLDAFLRTNGVRFFTAREVCPVGKLARDGKTRLKMAPRSLWPNIVPTLRLLDRARAHFGVPITINSGYRDPDYNRAVGGEKNSLHMVFNACDVVVGGQKPAAVAKWLHGQPQTNQLGIGGTYPNFTHIDTRGTIGRPAPARW